MLRLTVLDDSLKIRRGQLSKSARSRRVARETFEDEPAGRGLAFLHSQAHHTRTFPQRHDDKGTALAVLA